MSKTPSMSTRERRMKRAMLLERDGAHCHWCGHPVAKPRRGIQPNRDAAPNGKRWATIDHVVPLALGGAKRSLDNLVIACGDCNQERAKVA